MNAEKQLNQLLHVELRRAKRLAGWSYVGILMPVVGIVLGALSQSIVKGLPQPKSPNLADRFNGVRSLAMSGIVVSSIFLFLSLAGGAWSIYILDKGIKTLESTRYDEGYAAGKAEKESIQKVSQELKLDQCLTAADQNYHEEWDSTAKLNGYRDGKLPSALADQLNGYRQGQRDECYKRYPQ